jgi:hypothetical protein
MVSHESKVYVREMSPVFGSSTEGFSVADIRVACLYTLDLLSVNIFIFISYNEIKSVTSIDP